MIAVRALITFAGLVVLWQAAVMLTGLPHYLLPAPTRVAAILVERWDILWDNTQITMLEIALGLMLGVIFGASCALTLAASRYARRWLLPLLIVSQAMPTFAVAPLLVLWFGYGLGSKIVMAIIVIFFTVASSFYDGLRRTENDPKKIPAKGDPNQPCQRVSAIHQAGEGRPYQGERQQPENAER